MNRLSKYARPVTMLTLLLAIVVLCAPSLAQDPVTISFWSRDSNRALVEALAEQWNATHDNQIEVTIIPASDYITKVGTAVAAGAPPDLLAIDLIYVPEFAAGSRFSTSSAHRIFAWLAMKTVSMHCHSTPRRRYCCITRNFSSRLVSIPKSRQPPGMKSTMTPRRSPPWVMTSMGSISLVRVPGATPSRSCP